MTDQNLLQFNISDLLSGEVRNQKFDFDNAEIWLDEKNKAAVSGQALIFLIEPDTLLAKVSFRAKTTLSCVRCLEPFELSISGEFDQEYLPQQPKNTQENVFTYSPISNIIDLTEATRQEIIIQLPIKPLCEKSCKGLCQICGANLNQNLNHHHEQSQNE